MHELNIKYCIDCTARVETTVKWGIVHAPIYTVLESVHTHAHVLYNKVHIYVCKVSYFVFLANHNEVETELGQHKEERLVFAFNLSAAQFRLLSDLHIAERGACHALRAGSLIVEGEKKRNLAGIQTGERSALLIIVSSLQVSQLTVGGGWGRGR